jgi:hypothetical protein
VVRCSALLAFFSFICNSPFSSFRIFFLPSTLGRGRLFPFGYLSPLLHLTTFGPFRIDPSQLPLSTHLRYICSIIYPQPIYLPPTHVHNVEILEVCLLCFSQANVQAHSQPQGAQAPLLWRIACSRRICDRVRRRGASRPANGCWVQRLVRYLSATGLTLSRKIHGSPPTNLNTA